MRGFVLNLMGLLIGSVGLDYTYKKEHCASLKRAVNGIPSMGLLDILELEVHVSIERRENDNLCVKGFECVRLSDVCSRCSERFEFTIEKRLDLEFIPKNDKTESLLVEEDFVLFYSGNQLDLFPAIIESILLEIPIKPLCSKECLGLCPTCGGNLNVSSCDCKKPVVPASLAYYFGYHTSKRIKKYA